MTSHPTPQIPNKCSLLMTYLVTSPVFRASGLPNQFITSLTCKRDAALTHARGHLPYFLLLLN